MKINGSVSTIRNVLGITILIGLGFASYATTQADLKAVSNKVVKIEKEVEENRSIKYEVKQLIENNREKTKDIREMKKDIRDILIGITELKTIIKKNN